MNTSSHSEHYCPTLTQRQADMIFSQIVERLHIENKDFVNRRYFYKRFYRKFILRKAYLFTVIFCFYICLTHKISKLIK